MKIFWVLLGIVGIAALSGAGFVMSKMDSVIEVMAKAIQAFEGGKPGDRNMRNNNPGNIRWEPPLPQWLIDRGAIGKDSGNHVIFATFDQGYAELKRQLRLAFTGQSDNFYPSMSLYEYFAKYAEANQKPYAERVASALGVDPSTTLEELIS